MQDFLDDTSDVAVLFGVVIRSELDSALAGANMRLEDRALTLTLRLRETRHERLTRRHCIRTKNSEGNVVQLLKSTYLDVFSHLL